MASIQYSGLVNGIKGKVLGTVFQVGNGGNIIKSKGRALQRNSPRVSLQKQYIGYLSQNWLNIAESDKAAWAAACANYPSIDRFGNSRLPTAFALFMKLNGRIITYRAPELAVPAMPVQVTSITGSFCSNTSHADLVFTVTPLPDASTEYIVVDACAQSRPGRKVPPGGFKTIDYGSMGSSPTTREDAEYKAIYGTLTAGMNILFRLRCFNWKTGQYSVPVILEVLIT
jgi:hypothetical protein